MLIQRAFGRWAAIACAPSRNETTNNTNDTNLVRRIETSHFKSVATITLAACLVQCDQAIWRMCMRPFLLVIGAWSSVISHWLFAAEVASPLSPADAQQAFVLADSSLRIELAAAEPE